MGMALSPITKEHVNAFYKLTGTTGLGRSRYGGGIGTGGFTDRATPTLRLFAAGFGKQAPAAAPAETPAFQPGDDPNTAPAAQARQEAAASQLGATPEPGAASGQLEAPTDPIVGGRREAYLGRRKRGVGLAGLGRGFAASALLR